MTHLHISTPLPLAPLSLETAFSHLHVSHTHVTPRRRHRAADVSSPSISAPAIKDALLRVLGSSPSSPTPFALKAAESGRICKLSSAMPRVPGSRDELDTVKESRAAAVSDGRAGGEAYVPGRDVLAEWIYRLAASDVAIDAI